MAPSVASRTPGGVFSAIRTPKNTAPMISTMRPSLDIHQAPMAASAFSPDGGQSLSFSSTGFHSVTGLGSGVLVGRAGAAGKGVGAGVGASAIAGVEAGVGAGARAGVGQQQYWHVA